MGDFDITDALKRLRAMISSESLWYRLIGEVQDTQVHNIVVKSQGE